MPIPKEFTAEPISFSDLLDEAQCVSLPDPFTMCEKLGVDKMEFGAAIMNLAKDARFKPTTAQRDNILGVIGWGMCLGYFYAKREKPIILPS